MKETEATKPRRFDCAEACVDALLEAVGKRILLGLPLGLGKANHFVNALYARAAADPSISLTIFTALTLERPVAHGDIQQRFLQPLLDRLYKHYQDLAYTPARRKELLPNNIEVCEFFMKPGSYLGNATAQRSYVSSNYTHVVRDLLDRGINVIAQMVAPNPAGGDFSLSSNPDLTLPVVKKARAQENYQLVLIGEVNPQMPFMNGDAQLPASEFDFLLEGKEFDTPLFAVPSLPLSFVEYSLGLHVASMVADGGTLQIGIGALADAICHALILRQEHNELFRGLARDLTSDDSLQLRERLPPQLGRFARGLYGASEMVPPGFLHLRRTGVMTREVFPDRTIQELLDAGEISSVVSEETLLALKKYACIQCPLTKADTDYLQRMGIVDPSYSWRGHKFLNDQSEEVECDLHSSRGRERLLGNCNGKKLKGGIWLHGGFFLGSTAMYEELRQIPDKERAGINMTGIDFTNDFHKDLDLKTTQRKLARFVNEAMMVTLNGAVISDGLANGQVVSGVGGQYNFVAQAHELPGGRSVIALPSTHIRHGVVHSNIVWEYPNTTIPRHLRDIVVTEYGIADLRGKSDRDVICAMLCICDSRFQAELLQTAKSAGKVEQEYAIPLEFTANTPEKIEAVFAEQQRLDLLPYFPLGTDFTEEEALLAIALGQLKTHSKRWWKMLPLILAGRRACKDTSESAAYIRRCLRRMGYEQSNDYRHRLERYAVAGALRRFIDLRRPLLTPRSNRSS